MSAPKISRRGTVRGTARRVVIVPQPDGGAFEQAIFIVRGDCAVTETELLRQALEAALAGLGTGTAWQLLGPAPASVAKVNNRYRYRLTLTGTVDRRCRALAAQMIRAAHQDKENRGVSVYADWNPYSS